MKVLTILGLHVICATSQIAEFPLDFKFGVAESAYQIEGAWNADGKGESIWDIFTHTRPDLIADHSNGDIACDSYHRPEEDLDLVAWLGVNFYRFSLSWTRLFPTGFIDKINGNGVRYYNRLIDGLLERNITPLVTIYHWDLPQSLQDIGGWANPLLADYFVDYSREVFRLFGDRVKLWITINEPYHICEEGYGQGVLAPGVKSDGIGIYMCSRTILISHARVFRMYDKEFRISQHGKVGITADCFWYEPATNSTEDQEAAERAIQFHFGWWTHPIFSKTGDYPAVMKERIATASSGENFPRSRLIPLTESEVDLIRGSADFLGLNYYTAYLTSANTTKLNTRTPSYSNDVDVYTFYDPRWPRSGVSWLRVVPWGLRDVLNWIKSQYDNPLVYITENGYVDTEEFDDRGTIKYIKEHLNATLEAIKHDGCNVKAYTVWSLMDDFEWEGGYTSRFGLIHVDFESANRTRSKKKSAYYYKCVAENKSYICVL